jgi:hypothetical protein
MFRAVNKNMKRDEVGAYKDIVHPTFLCAAKSLSKKPDVLLKLEAC